jgi:DNA-binding CsgD family transcriptional regulator/PAS domain-containing protein
VNKAAIIAHDIAGQNHAILAWVGDAVKEGGGLYEKHYWQFDEWTSRHLRRGMREKVAVGEEVWPEQDLRKSTFYNEFLTHFDICQTAGIVLRAGSCNLDAISIYRGPREECLGQEQLHVLNAIAPHLQIALATRRKLAELEGRISDLEAALDSMRTALVLVDKAAKVVYVNAQAKGILAEPDGLFIHRCSLMAQNTKESSHLRVLIENAVATFTGKCTASGGAMALVRPGKGPLNILVSPISPADRLPPGNAAAAIFLDDPELHPVIPEEVLRMLFGLSAAEARLAVRILNGNSTSEAAELGQVSRETVKSQLSAVFHKTGTRRQGELIRLLSTLPSMQVRIHT